MSAIDITKATVGTIASISANITVCVVIKSVAPAELTPVQKVAFGIGAVALGFAAGKVAGSSVVKIIDESIALW